MIEILYEDKDIVFCVKPVGMSSEHDLPQELKQQLDCEIFTLHRLDTPVGGVMVYAKNKISAAKISKKIADNSDFNKTYLTVCEGEFENPEGVMKDLLFNAFSFFFNNKAFIF